MMNPREVASLLKATPFQPLEFVFSDGSREIVEHPDNVVLTATTVVIAQYDKQIDPPFADWLKTYALVHLVSIEPAQRQSA